MSDRLHIIITGNEQKPHRFILSKQKLQLAVFTSLALFIILGIGSFQATRLFQANSSLSDQVAGLSQQLQDSNSLQQQFSGQVQKLQQENSSQANAFAEEKTILINGALSALEERSQMIEQVMCNIGVDVEKATKNSANKGGPFVTSADDLGKELLVLSDKYLDTMNYLPLGRPVPGRITSRFGHRTDPVNGKKGFHTGVDMRGRYGQEILATADGVVSKAFTNGGYGKFVEIRHGNGYTTAFAHMKKILVKRGATVKRGQVIGTVGSSGRSTGPHLHYEVCLWKKPLNPNKFMQVEKLILAPVIPQLTAKLRKKINPIILAQKNAETTKAMEAFHVPIQ